jgi:phosphatidylglycerol lysyltransferase
MTYSTADVPEVAESSPRPRWGRRAAIVVAIVLVVVGVKFLLHLLLPRNFAGGGVPLPLELASGPFQTLYYCGPAAPKGVVILGTGDGGWSYWEERVAKHLAERGYAVGGWDCRKFADTRKFDHAELIAGFNAAVEAVKARSRAGDVPVWFAGWSTGAEQAVAAAATSDRHERLAGLLVAAPGTRGRFGITTSDLLGVLPEGPGSFAMTDMARELGKLPVVQFAAGLDPLDDVDWIASVPGPHRVVVLEATLHDMGGAGDEFLQDLDEGMAWTLDGMAGFDGSQADN